MKGTLSFIPHPSALIPSLEVAVEVLEERRYDDGGGLGAERAPAERDDRPAARAREFDLLVVPTALRPDERRDERGAGLNANRERIQTDAAALREEHAQFARARRDGGEAVERDRPGDRGDSRAARLLRGFEREPTPALDASLGLSPVTQTNVRALRQDGRDAPRAQLGRLLHDQVELLALQQSDRERQLKRRLRALRLDAPAHFERRRAAPARLAHDARELAPLPPEHQRLVAPAPTHHLAQVSR